MCERERRMGLEPGPKTQSSLTRDCRGAGRDLSPEARIDYCCERRGPQCLGGASPYATNQMVGPSRKCLAATATSTVPPFSEDCSLVVSAAEEAKCTDPKGADVVIDRFETKSLQRARTAVGGPRRTRL